MEDQLTPISLAIVLAVIGLAGKALIVVEKMIDKKRSNGNGDARPIYPVCYYDPQHYERIKRIESEVVRNTHGKYRWLEDVEKLVREATANIVGAINGK